MRQCSISGGIGPFRDCFNNTRVAAGSRLNLLDPNLLDDFRQEPIQVVIDLESTWPMHWLLTKKSRAIAQTTWFFQVHFQSTMLTARSLKRPAQTHTRHRESPQPSARPVKQVDQRLIAMIKGTARLKIPGIHAHVARANCRGQRPLSKALLRGREA